MIWCSFKPETKISGSLNAHLVFIGVPEYLFGEVLSQINDGMHEIDVDNSYPFDITLQSDMGEVRINCLHILYDKFLPHRAIMFKEVINPTTKEKELYMTRWVKISEEEDITTSKKKENSYSQSYE